MYIQQTYQERIIFSILLLFIILITSIENIINNYSTTTHKHTNIESIYRLYEQFLSPSSTTTSKPISNTTKLPHGCTDSFLSSIIQDTLYNYIGKDTRVHSISQNGSLGLLSMTIRLQVLCSAGLLTKEKIHNKIYYTVTNTTFKLLEKCIPSLSSSDDNILQYIFANNRTFDELLTNIDSIYMEQALTNTISTTSSSNTKEQSVAISTTEYSNPLQFVLPIKVGKPWRGNE